MATQVERAHRRELRETVESKSPQLLERTFALLALFTTERPEWTTTEISRACELPVPTSHRILVALQRHGYLVRDGLTKRFRLGPAALALGRSSQTAMDLRTASIPFLQSISVQTGETALLTVPSEDRQYSTCIERVESAHPLRLSVTPGRGVPLHAGAQQKALLAFLPQQDVERVLAGPLEKLCKATITEPQRLREELKSIREKGWAKSFEETNLGVWGLAMTLLDRQHQVVASLGIAGPQVRLQRGLLTKWLELLSTDLRELAEKLELQSPNSGSDTVRLA